MVQNDLGAATIVYEGPDGEPVELTVENEHVAYFQDHWVVKIDDEERTPQESGADASGSEGNATGESAGEAAGESEDETSWDSTDGDGEESTGQDTGTEEAEFEPDTVRRIPAARVYHVERDVETFEEEIGTRLDDVQSVAESLENELRSRVESVAGGVPSRLFERGGDRPTGEVQRIEVEVGGDDGDEGGDEPGEQERPAS